MGKIEVLDKNLINQIAAGEVIERPSSVIKELVENSIDSGANNIIIEIENAGKDKISIMDNGCGMSIEDAKKSIIKHATSKIKTNEDLFNIYTMGFRGEALASIASISKLQIITKDNNHTGIKLYIEDSKIKNSEEFPRENGTSIIVKDLFYNTPARLKYMRDNYLENSSIIKIIQNYVLIHPEINFELKINNKEIIKAPKNNFKNNLLSIFDLDIAKQFLIINYNDEEKKLKIDGCISKPNINRNNKNEIYIYFNKRPVKNSIVYRAIMDAYHNLLFNKKYPICILNIEIDNELIDVNVHPQKKEIRVKNENELYELVYTSIRNKLEKSNLTQDLDEEKEKNQLRMDGTKIKTKNYEKYTYESINKDFDLSNEKGSEIKKENLQDSLKLKKNIKERFNPELHNTQEELSYNTFEEEEDFEYEFQSENKFSDNNTDKNYIVGQNDHLYSKLQNDEEFEKEFIKYINTNNKLKNKENYNFQKGIKVIGQFHNSFILAQDEKGLLVIDQHVAEERYYYEQFMEKYFNKNIEVQEILNPIAINLTPEEYNFTINNIENFEKLGMNIEEFGNNQIKVRTLPIIFNRLQDTNFFFSLLENLQKENIFKINRKKHKHIFNEEIENNENYNIIDEIKEKIITKMACMTSVKACEQLTISKMQSIVDKWALTKNKNTCPHGRPIQIRLNFAHIWKQFKRDG